MNYTKKDIVAGFVIVVVIFISIYLFKNYSNKKSVTQKSPIPVSVTYKDSFEKKFKYTIPEGVATYELKDVSGGNSMGIATDTELLADMEDPQYGYSYQAWKETNEGKLYLIGNLKMLKGGWMIDYDRSKLEDAKKIIVSLEKRNDSIIEKRILEGSFN